MNIQGRGILINYSHLFFFSFFTHSFANPGVKKFKERREEKYYLLNYDMSKEEFMERVQSAIDNRTM